MKKYRIIISLTLVIALVLTTGFLLKENRFVYNYGDTYYVLDYFVISKIVSVVIAFLGLVWFCYRKLIAKK
ncbi:hypothetical protein D0817_24495 [Flavobacterium cupreum]|uniref:Uncharacterized protein n=1 Tax=Flavobacterium cupreum TaxID=2133766 RepID=A0A434A0C7_9FLAO|nr:hypothetical protein D0817_24495 [Flavobacterium cupreum]